VLAHAEQRVDHRLARGGADVRVDVANQLATIRADFFEDRLRRREIVEAPDAAIVWIRPPFQQTALFEPIDKTRNGDRLHLADRREFALRKPGLPLDARQDVPLRACHAPGARPLVEPGAHDPCDVIQKYDRVPVE